MFDGNKLYALSSALDAIDDYKWDWPLVWERQAKNAWSALGDLYLEADRIIGLMKAEEKLPG